MITLMEQELAQQKKDIHWKEREYFKNCDTITINCLEKKKKTSLHAS